MSRTGMWRNPKRSAIADQQRFSRGVVLLHGIARTSRSLDRIEGALREAHFATFNLDYESRRQPLDALAEAIHPEIERFAGSIDGPVHFVAHSMGGLLARVYLAKHRPARLGRVVMLGTPNGGSEVADLLQGLAIYRAFFGPAGQQLSTTQDQTLRSLPPVDYALGIIAGCRSIDPISSVFILPRPNDGKVSVHHTKLDGMAAHTVVEASHPGLVVHAKAIEQTIAFLQDGRFNAIALSSEAAAVSRNESRQNKRASPDCIRTDSIFRFAADEPAFRCPVVGRRQTSFSR